MIINICCCPYFGFSPVLFFTFESFPCGKVWHVNGGCVCVCVLGEVLSHGFILFQFLNSVSLCSRSFCFHFERPTHSVLSVGVWLSHLYTTFCMLACQLCPAKFVFCPYCAQYKHTIHMHLCTLYNMGHQNRFHVISTLV